MRMITANGRSLSCVTAYAFSAAANTDAPSTAAGIASTPHHDGTPPRIVATTRNTVADRSTRRQVHSTCPANSAPALIGVATAAWYVRIHFTPPRTGQSDSPAACIMALAAMSPGVTNTR